MNDALWGERLAERKVTYTLEANGQLCVIANVPARVNLNTGEQLFAPDTVARLQALVWEHQPPVRMMQVPVYDYA